MKIKLLFKTTILEKIGYSFVLLIFFSFISILLTFIPEKIENLSYTSFLLIVIIYFIFVLRLIVKNWEESEEIMECEEFKVIKDENTLQKLVTELIGRDNDDNQYKSLQKQIDLQAEQIMLLNRREDSLLKIVENINGKRSKKK